MSSKKRLGIIENALKEGLSGIPEKLQEAKKSRLNQVEKLALEIELKASMLRTLKKVQVFYKPSTERGTK